MICIRLQDEKVQNLTRKNELYFECIKILDKVEQCGNVDFVNHIPKAIGGTSILLSLKNICQQYGELKIVWVSYFRRKRKLLEKLYCLAIIF